MMTNTTTTTNDDAQEYLLVQDEPQPMMMERLISKLQTYSVLIGICCGIFVQLSTLGANFLLVALWGEEAVIARSQQEAMLFSLAWSFFTSCMALLILSMLRGLITSILDSSSSSYEGENATMDRDGLMMTIEVRYVVGSLMGVCLAWTCTDLLLGMQSLALYSMGTLVLALVWSKVMIWCFVSRNNNITDDEEEEDNDRAAKMMIV